MGARDVIRVDGAIHTNSLSLRTDSTFLRGSNVQDSSGAPRAYATAEGAFTERGYSLFLRTTVLRTWDRDFNGGTVIVTPANTGSPYGPGALHFDVRNDSLVLHFLGYCSNGVTETTAAFARLLAIEARPR